MTVRIALPRLLAPVVGDRLVLDVDASVLADVLDALCAALPAVCPHLFDHHGALRPHVTCFVDGVASRLEDRKVPVRVEVRFLHGVSGG